MTHVVEHRSGVRRLRQLSFGRQLGLVVLLAALTRAVLVIWRWHHPLLFNDSLYYTSQARDFIHGKGFRQLFFPQHPGADHGPLTSILLAPVSWMHNPVPWQRMVTAACGVASVGVIGLVGRALGGRRVGLLAAGLAVIYPNLWLSDALVMSESVSILIVSVTLLLLVRLLDCADQRQALVRTLVLGAVLGLGSLARSELVLMVPLVAGALWWAWRQRGLARGGWRALVLVVVAVAVMAPWVGYNLARFEKPVLLTTNDGTTLLGASCHDTFYGPTLGGWVVFCASTDDPAYATDEEPSVRSDRQRRMAITYTTHHLGRLPVVEAARVGRTLDLYSLGNLVASDVGEERPRLGVWLGIAAWWLLAIPAALGVWRLRRAHRWAMVLPVIVVAATTVVFYGAHRFRSSMEPVVVIGAALTLTRWTRARWGVART